jgi:glyoxylase-like metal-dependent hydrolase (beta-lactamase superfamily II)
MTTEQILIDKEQLAAWLKERKPVTILDIRPVEERQEWAIPGSVHVNVYDRLKAGDPNAFDHVTLSNSQPIVTVCGSGRLSVTAAQQLVERGFHAFSLQGGMKAWNFAFNTAEVAFVHAKVIQVRRSAKGCLSYIIGSGNEAVVIDAGLDPRVYLDLAKQNGWTIKFVTDTHVHADYLSRSRELAQAGNAKHILLDKFSVDYSFQPLAHGTVLTFGSAELLILHTPGHTPESTSFQLGNDAVFTGDTLFVDGVGRPDLKADSTEAVRKSKLLHASVHQLMKLNSDSLVFPAHVATAVPFDSRPITASIQNLKNKLEILSLNEEEFVKYTTSRIPPTPPNYLTIAELNKKGSFDGHSPAELEAGANRCAIA